MITQQMLLDKWKAIKNKGYGYQLVDPDHPLQWYVGFSDIGKTTLLLLTSVCAPRINSSKSIEITLGFRPDELWAINFNLLRIDQIDVFALLCADIIEYSRKAKSDEDGLDKTVSRYKQWNLLMERQKSPLLSESSQKGLIGELLVMKDLNETKGFALASIIGAWQEPEYSDQDFRFAETWYEVKTTGISSHAVTISSAEQLDSDIDGHLAIYRIDRCNADDPRAITLLDAVQMVKDLLSNDLTALTSFEHKLTEYGFIDAPDYGQQHYKPGRLDYYTVGSSFPRILRSALPVAVLNTSYSLDIAAIDTWRE